MPPATGLAGRAVLVTRPAHQAGPLAALIRERGGEPVLFPTIEIRAAPDPQPLQQAVDERADFEIAIFVSGNAVAKAWPAVAAAGGFASGTRFVAVGEGTAAALRSGGANDVLTPARGADSEALLAMPELQDVAHRRIAVFSGVGGRDLLATELAARGAIVTVVPCYRRVRPEGAVAPVRARLAAGTLSAITATSAEGVRNLYAMLAADTDAVARLPHVVPHDRVADAARACGATLVRVCGSGDAAMVTALTDVFALGLAPTAS